MDASALESRLRVIQEPVLFGSKQNVEKKNEQKVARGGRETRKWKDTGGCRGVCTILETPGMHILSTHGLCSRCEPEV